MRRNNGTSIFPRIEELGKDLLSQLDPDDSYMSEQARLYDLSWQAVQCGYIGDAKTYSHFEEIPLVDEYHFIRKYFHKAWVIYVLIIRIFGFNNPFKELLAFYRTREIRRKQTVLNPIEYGNWDTFNSKLLASAPRISVVIPTLNRYTYLRDVLNDFELQDYTNFEIIIVDQSKPFKHSFYDQFSLDIKVVEQEEPALWLARNTAIRTAEGELIALSEDDVRIEPDWLTQHIKCLDFFKAHISAGVFFPEGQRLSPEQSHFKAASHFATGNALLFKGIFEKVGLFDRQFEKQRMGDGEFGLRIFLNGYKSISNPKASCTDIKADIGGLREMGSWDAFRTKNWLAPRPVPSVLYFFRKYFGNSAARFALLRTIPISVMPYRFKRNKGLKLLGAFFMIIIFPITLFQVSRSWYLASRKLKEGDLIESLS